MFNQLNNVSLLYYLVFILCIINSNLKIIDSHQLNLRSVNLKTSTSISTSLETDQSTPTHHHILDEGLTGELISSFLIPKDLYNYALTNRQNVQSTILKQKLPILIKEGLELIKKTKNYLSNELSKSAQKLKKILKALPFIPTKVTSYAYNYYKREALSLLVQYNVVFDM